jgi:aryl-alcohol dehydrogenase-like predicted oxidoreductase
MQPRPLGSTGLRASILGFGAGHIGGEDLPDGEAGRILNEALDLGITFFDTARSYGLSEERIGRHLSHRRGEYVLSTKGGYGVDGLADWTEQAIARGIDEALVRLRTDVIDVFHLHSCDAHVFPRTAFDERSRTPGTRGRSALRPTPGRTKPSTRPSRCRCSVRSSAR